MYSMVLVVAMTGAPSDPQCCFGWGKGGNGCVGYAAPAAPCPAPCPAPAPAPAPCPAPCPAPAPVAYGCNGGCGGHFGGKFGGLCCGFGGKLKGCFSCFGKGNGCNGGCGGYAAGPVGYAPTPGCGQTVIPPAPGGVYVPGAAYPPGTVITTQPGTVTTTQPGTTTTTTTTTIKKEMPKVVDKK